MAFSAGLKLGVGMACVAISVSCGDDPPPPAPTGNIVVSFPGTTAADPVLFLYSGRLGSECVTFQPHVASPSVTLTGVSYDPECQAEFDAFAPTLGAYARDVDPNNAGSEGWLVNAISAGSIAISLPGLKRVPLRFWLVAPSGAMQNRRDVRKRLLDKAYAIFDPLGSGLTFDTVSTELSPSLPLAATCANAAAISMNPAIYDASRINAYFVDWYGNNPGLTLAETCWMAGHPEIMLFSTENPDLTDPSLAHELGHALGLVHPNSTIGGHTDFESGFDAFNLMASNIEVTNISIGQMYALNFSADSWLNRTGSTLSSAVVRACANSWAATPCASLKLFQPGWP